MYKEKKIAVVIPAYNEGKLIEVTLKGMPDYVDTMYVVEDGSSDNTLERIKKCMETDKRIILIEHEQNKGLGQTLIDGYMASKYSDNDITAVMAGDNQMDPEDLPGLLDKIVDQDFPSASSKTLYQSSLAHIQDVCLGSESTSNLFHQTCL